MRAHVPISAALAVTLAWSVPAAHALAPPAVELLRPADGEVLTGGGGAVVAWRPAGAPLDGVPLDAAIEEWEAFLSFDGGVTYPVRITPHLDASQRRFTFRVPAVATADARLLLRFGDERREVGVEIDHRFSIAPPSFHLPEPGRPALGRGEPARPGEKGVVAWMEGTRHGSGLAYFVAMPARSAEPVVVPGGARAEPALPPQLVGLALAPQSSHLHRRPPSRPAGLEGASKRLDSILLLGCRQNE